MKNEPTYFNDLIMPWLGKLGKIFSRKLEQSFKKNNINLTKEQWVVLKNLNQKDGLTQNELAERMYSDKTSVTRLINNLEKKKMVSRCECDTDKRVNLVCLTPKGEAIFYEALPMIRAIAQEMQNNLNKTEINTTMNLLQKVFQNLDAL